MRKTCIFNDKKICNSCGECEICDLNRNKKCNNCGQCLEQQGFDTKAIKIDEIMDTSEDSEEFLNETIDETVKEKEEELDLNYEYVEFNDDNLELIDDVEGLREVLEDQKVFEKVAVEEFPGFIRIKKK